MNTHAIATGLTKLAKGVRKARPLVGLIGGMAASEVVSGFFGKVAPNFMGDSEIQKFMTKAGCFAIGVAVSQQVTQAMETETEQLALIFDNSAHILENSKVTVKKREEEEDGGASNESQSFVPCAE